MHGSQTLGALAGPVLVALASAIFYFGRNLEPEATLAPNSILSAADVWVSTVRKLPYDDLLEKIGIEDLQETILAANWSQKSNFWLVSVFVSVTEVHLKGKPLTGIVTAIAY